MNDNQIQAKIDEFFDSNYRQILAEGGAHILTPHALEQARQQVEHYWKKLRDIATNVTETEVRLQLPNRLTPKRRRFVIEGVVDLVREADRIRMYDIKTHYCGEVRDHQALYAAQLNLYAYIWRELRGYEVHQMGVIAIQLPERLRAAIRESNHAEIARQMQLWNPLVPIEPEPESIDAMFEEIARAVDSIEDGEFSAPPPEKLASISGEDENSGGKQISFATLHCRNCDGRFSCDSYRQYARIDSRQSRKVELWNAPNPLGDAELDDWINGNIELDLDELDGD